MPTEKINLNKFCIAGTQFRKVPQEKLLTLEKGSIVLFEREPENKFDKNAVACYAYLDMDGPTHIGYVPKELARHFSPMLANGLKLHAEVNTVTSTKPIVWVTLVWERED